MEKTQYTAMRFTDTHHWFFTPEEIGMPECVSFIRDGHDIIVLVTDESRREECFAMFEEAYNLCKKNNEERDKKITAERKSFSRKMNKRGLNCKALERCNDEEVVDLVETIKRLWKDAKSELQEEQWDMSACYFGDANDLLEVGRLWVRGKKEEARDKAQSLDTCVREVVPEKIYYWGE